MFYKSEEMISDLTTSEGIYWNIQEMQEVMGSLPYSMHWVEEEDFDTESCIWFASYNIIDPAAKHFEWFIIELEWRSVKSWLRCFGINVTLQSEVGRAQNQQGLLSFKFWPQPPLQHIRFFLDNLMPINFNNFLRTHRTENFPLFNEKKATNIKNVAKCLTTR